MLLSGGPRIIGRMSSDWVARGIAAASAAIGMTSLMWAVLSWRLAGPALRIHALAYREELVLRVFNAGRTAESIENIVLGGRRGGNGGLDLTRHLELPMRLEPGQTKLWRLDPHFPVLSDRWRTVAGGWASLWVLTGSMREHRAEVVPLSDGRPPAVGWRLVPRRTKLARYAPLVVGTPVAAVAASEGSSPLAAWLVSTLCLAVAVRAFWVSGTSKSFGRRRVERWALAAASLVSVVEFARASGRPVGADLPTADMALLVALFAVAFALAVPGAAPEVVAVPRLLAARTEASWAQLRGRFSGRATDT